ncbi:MAG: hypothetical protein WDZ35_06805 [Crocinitomicaceae bacterium]
MRHPDRIYFEVLKQELVNRFREQHPDSPVDLSEWNGRMIENFQNELLEKVKGRISTRWFYDHLKTDQEDKLPRIDILNLLSEYCGYKNWDDFKTQKIEEGIKEDRPKKDKKNYRHSILILLLLILVTSLISMIVLQTENKIECKLCFTDSDFGIPIVDKNLEIQLIGENTELQVFKADSGGCVSLNPDKKELRFIAKADYYKTDTFTMNMYDKQIKKIPLKIDDYSMFIHQLSVSNTEDWERRREQLDKIIHADAMIILVTNDNQGIEMFNREEFIDRMTMPIGNLKNLRILETKYMDGEIIKMRITQEDERK